MIRICKSQVQVGDEILDIQGISVTGRSSEMTSAFKQALMGPKVYLECFMTEPPSPCHPLKDSSQQLSNLNTVLQGSMVMLRLCRQGLVLSAAIQRGGYVEHCSPPNSQDPPAPHGEVYLLCA